MRNRSFRLECVFSFPIQLSRWFINVYSPAGSLPASVIAEKRTGYSFRGPSELRSILHKLLSWVWQYKTLSSNKLNSHAARMCFGSVKCSAVWKMVPQGINVMSYETQRRNNSDNEDINRRTQSQQAGCQSKWSMFKNVLHVKHLHTLKLWLGD